ncbi:DUF397 domain-containing protein [Streptomyces xantholiticus]
MPSVGPSSSSDGTRPANAAPSPSDAPDSPRSGARGHDGARQGGYALHPTTAWHKSSHSLNEDSFCVEAARFPDGRTGVRDSKVPDGPVLLMPTARWTAFVEHLKRLHHSSP